MFKKSVYILFYLGLTTILYINRCCPLRGQGIGPANMKSAAIDTLSFDNIGVEDGLSNNAVTCLMQDHYGLIWMGTYDGLNRYDGADFDVFRNKLSDTFSLINNHVTVIKEGRPGTIWVGTQMGFVRFDYQDFKFHTAYYLPQGEKQALKTRARVKDMLADSTGKVLVATENYGLLFKGAGERVFRQILLTGNAGLNVTAIAPYAKGTYLVYLKDKGLYQFNPRGGLLTALSSTIPVATRLLYEPAMGELLVGTEEGLFTYNLTQKTVSEYSKQLSRCNITNLLRDKKGILWVSTDGNGLAVLPKGADPKTGFEFIKQGREKNQLKSAAVYNVYEDKKGRKWVATLRGGVSLLHTENAAFKTISKDDFNPNVINCYEEKAIKVDTIWKFLIIS